MPTNRTRRTRTARADPVAAAAAWSELFDSGYDFFGDAKAFGVPLDDVGRADEGLARETWRRLGALHLSRRNPDLDTRPWALEQFGEPVCR